jgi:hypothetical protein
VSWIEIFVAAIVVLGMLAIFFNARNTGWRSDGDTPRWGSESSDGGGDGGGGGGD